MEQKISWRVLSALAICVIAAFLLRTLPSWKVVFANGVVNFQEGDGWFHVRTVHNLLAHFPRRSGFDPYMLFPRGQNVPTAPVWDYMIAVPAWILGLGSPSSALIDFVAAWLPAILGAIFPIPAFFLARRVLGDAAGMFAALWTAVGFGAFLWLTHLGLADHHAAEGFFAFVTLAWMCAALDEKGPRAAWLAGIALGLFLGTRPAGIFVPVTFACFVILEPAAAPAVLRATLAAAGTFFLAAGTLWSDYTWLSLGVTGAAAAAVLAIDTGGRRLGWPQWARRATPFALAALGAAAVLLARPQLVSSLWFQIRRYVPGSPMVSSVQELLPVYRATPQPGWSSVLHELGAVWIPALAAMPFLLFGRVRPAVRLLGLWSLVMAAAACLQVRMTIYFLPVASVLAGIACAWLVARCPPALQRTAAILCAVGIAAVNVPLSIAALQHNNGITADWLAAFRWLRENSPEPVSDPGAWSRDYAAVPAGVAPPAAASWGVAIWWDRAYEMEQLAHRAPMANGTQAGAEDMARFYTETIPEAAVGWLRRAGARYVVVDPQSPWFYRRNASRFPAQLAMLGRDPSGYVQVLSTHAGGNEIVTVYLDAYYQSMAARLYLSDGEAVAGTGPWLFETEPVQTGTGQTIETIVATRHFSTEAEAAGYISRRSYSHLTIGCLDPGHSCVPLGPVKGLKRVFASTLPTLVPGQLMRSVKIFEVEPGEN